MKRSDANNLARALLQRYEKDLRKPPKGKKYQDCYDVDTGKPKPEYLDFNKKMRAKILDLGIDVQN